MIKKFKNLFAALLFCYFAVSGQPPIKPYIVIGPQIYNPAYDAGLLNVYEFKSKKLYLIEDIHSLIGCQKALKNDIKNLITFKAFRHVVVLGHGSSTGDIEIGNSTHRSLLLNILLAKVPEEERKKYSFLLEIYACHAGIGISDMPGDNLAAEFDSLPCNTVLMLHAGGHPVLRVVGEKIFSEGLDAGNRSAFQRLIQRIYSSPQALKVIFKDKAGKCFSFESNGPGVEMKQEIVRSHLKERIMEARDWWKKYVLNEFTDNTILSGDNCDSIANSIINQLTNEHVYAYMQQALFLAMYENEDIEFFEDSLLRTDYSISGMTYLGALVCNEQYNIGFLRQVLQYGHAHVNAKLPGNITALDVIVNNWNCTDQQVLRKKNFIKELLEEDVIITRSTMQQVQDRELMKIILLSPSFCDTRWNYNDLMNILPDTLKQMAAEIIIEYVQSLFDNYFFVDRRLFNNLFQEGSWIRESYAGYLPGLLDDVISKHKNKDIAIHLLKCGLPFDSGMPALFAAMMYGKDDKEYNEVVDYLVKKYTKDKKQLPCMMEFTRNESAFIKAVEWDNIEALQILLSAARTASGTFYHQDVFQTLKYAIEKNKYEATELILQCPGFKMNDAEIIVIQQIVKNKRDRVYESTLKVLQENYSKSHSN